MHISIFYSIETVSKFNFLNTIKNIPTIPNHKFVCELELEPEIENSKACRQIHFPSIFSICGGCTISIREKIFPHAKFSCNRYVQKYMGFRSLL